jgi:tetratricopeptide (TPR) repeat protein
MKCSTLRRGNVHQGLRLWRRVGAFTFLILTLYTLPAGGADFPGPGSRLQWGYALQYFNLANRYVQQDRYEEAIIQYSEAISRYQYDPDFYTNMGLAYYKLNRFDDAESSFKKAVQLGGKDWVPWLNLANVYSKQDKLSQALSIFEQTLKYNPPPAEKDVIQGNIKGIKRILSNRQPRGGDSVPPGGSQKACRGDAMHRPGSPTGSGSGAKTPAQKDCRGDAIYRPGSQATDGTFPAARTTSGITRFVQSADKQSLKQSGWDYSYQP